MKTMDCKTLNHMLIHVSKEIIQQEPYLSEIDTIIGDGDHGTGMKTGFEAVQKMLERQEFQKPSALLQAVGMELVKTMGGASGVLFGTLFTGGLPSLPDENELDAEHLIEYFSKGTEMIHKRGKANAGDKTMLDALYPAIEAMRNGTDTSIEQLLYRGYQGALLGVFATKTMKARTGRSKNFKETLGVPDPGAVSVSVIFKAMYEFIQTKTKNEGE